MSLARRQAQSPTPGRRKHDALRRKQQPEIEPSLVERRVAEALWAAAGRTSSLVGVLRGVPEVERATARLVLIRVVGARWARDLLTEAYGAGAAEFEVGVASEATEEEPDRDALKRYARAVHIKDTVLRALEANPTPESLLALLASTERPVTVSALWLLKRQSFGERTAFEALDQLTRGEASRLARAGAGDAPDVAPLMTAFRSALARHGAHGRVRGNERSDGVAHAHAHTHVHAHAHAHTHVHAHAHAHV